MKDAVTSETPFLMCSPGVYLFSVRAGVPAPEALSQAAELLEVGHGLMLLADEMDSSIARAAATWIVETAHTALLAAISNG
ncbi:MAG: DUF3077 domain-containing protein [Porticoccaceae bacterium]